MGRAVMSVDPVPKGSGAPSVVAPTRADPVAAGASERFGGPAGRRASSPPDRRGRGPALLALLALTLLTFAVGLLTKAPCREAGWEREVAYTHVCYSDIPLLYAERGLAAGQAPYLDSAVEYPVLTGAVMGATAYAAARLAPEGDQLARARAYFDVNAVLLAVAAGVTVVGLVGLAGRRPWDAALFALAPGLALSAVINWDLLAVALATLALLAWARRRPVVAGALIGLATATKLYPVLLLVPLLLLCFRAGRLAVFTRTAAATAGAWLAVNVPVALVAPAAWAEFYTFSRERGASFGSPFYWWATEVGPLDASDGAPTTLNLLSGATLLLLLAAIAGLALAAPRRPRVAALAFLVVAAFCLTNKVYSPQYLLWLLPLAALARPRWRDLLAWQAAEAIYYLAVWYHLAALDGDAKGLPLTTYWLALWLHVFATAAFAGLVVRDVLHPRSDPVRASGMDDPAGGVLDGAADAVVLRRTTW